MDDIVRIENLSKSYDNRPAVRGLSLSVPRGTVFGLLGANGSGKTTTIECALGTKTMDKGTVSILGMNPVTDRKRLFERVGVQFQESGHQEGIRVGELCELTAALYAKPAQPGALLAQFGLLEKKDALVRELSGGQKQRLFIVLALLPQPEVVFLDELTTGLDVKARRDVWQYLKRMKADGLTIVLTSHFMDEVEALCDRIMILRHGETVFSGTVGQAIEQSPHGTFEAAYLWHAGEEESA